MPLCEAAEPQRSLTFCIVVPLCGIYVVFCAYNPMSRGQYCYLTCILISAIHEFPEDLFTNRERTRGAVLLHIFAVGKLSVCDCAVKTCSPSTNVPVIQNTPSSSDNFMIIANCLSAAHCAM